MLTHRRRSQRVDGSLVVDQPPAYEERDYWHTSSATLIDSVGQSSMGNPIAEEAYERRFSTGHYVGFYLFAVLAPPGVFFLCHLPDRPPWRDFKHNLAYLTLGLWVGGVVHACLFVSDVYRYQHDQERKHFHEKRISTLPRPQHTYDNPRRPTGQLTVENLQNAPQANVASPDSAPDEANPSRPGVAVLQDDSNIQPVPRQESVLPELPTFKPRPSRDRRSIASTARTGSMFSRASSTVSSVFSRTASKPRHLSHKKVCPLCKKCERCYHQHVQYDEETYELRAAYGSERSGTSMDVYDERLAEDHQYVEHSRERHLHERHHFNGCCCETCTGLKRVSRDFGDHSVGCVCELCKPSTKEMYRNLPQGSRGSGWSGYSNRSCGGGVGGIFRGPGGAGMGPG